MVEVVGQRRVWGLAGYSYKQGGLVQAKLEE